MAGESYAGHYIPAMTDYFTTLGKDTSYTGNDKKINVVRIAIGNGWSIPKIQYNFGSYANNLGILSSPDSKRLEAQYHLCVRQVNNGDFSSGGACNIIGQVLAASGACPLAESESDNSKHGKGISKHRHKLPANASCFGPLLNYYDTRSYYVNILSSWPASAEVTGDYLNSSDVMKAVHVKQLNGGYAECDDAGQYLMVLYGLGVQPQIINILEAGVGVTFYSGQYDFVCNHIGTERMLDQLPWSGKNDFENARGYVWVLNHTESSIGGNVVEKVPAGYGRSSSDGRLTFLVVIGGSHMVPMDVPVAALDLIRRITQNLPFSDFPQEIDIKMQSENDGNILYSHNDSVVSSKLLNIAAILFLFLTFAALVRFGLKNSAERYTYQTILEVP